MRSWGHIRWGHQETCLPVSVRSSLRKWEHTYTYVLVIDDDQQRGRLRFSAVDLTKLLNDHMY